MYLTCLSAHDAAVATGLEENGFYYDGRTVVNGYPPLGQMEEFLGWEILWEVQTSSVFAVTHQATGCYWFPFVEGGTSQTVEQVKQIIQSAITNYLNSKINP